ncbi:hypothetical protein [Vulgatibacter sp.]|uniref:metallophosphoesterase family protein n=1 Tax=Vulgatibacter sp. TaxID=1971226 RepID=UPI0035649673
MNRRILTAVGAAALLAACSDNKPAAEPEKAAPAPAPKAAAPAAPASDASVASVPGKSDPECVGPIDTAVPETRTIGDRTVEVNGYRLTVKSAEDADEKAVVGVLANLNEASGENLFNLERYLGFFRENGAEMIVVAGDSGQDRANIEAVLRKVAASGLPVLAIAGNREARADYVDAVAAVQKDQPNLINGNRVRYVDWDDADFVTLPGYHDPRYIHASGAGCQYSKEDVGALKKLTAAANDAVVLVAHGQPLGTAPTALDVIAPDKKHVGDPNLTTVLETAGIPFGIFPNIKEAGGIAVADLAGEKVLADGTASEKLFLNPGAADSIEWTMNDGTTSVGTAAILAIEGKQATHRIYRAAKLSDAEKAQAAKLAPALEQPATAQTE